jgi:hypothetical protein
LGSQHISQDSAALANTDYVQLEELFQQLLKAPDAEATAQNCLVDNRYSGVRCSAAIRDLTLTKCASSVMTHTMSSAFLEPPCICRA